MRKPKFFKKSLSFFLAFLMLMSSLTVGFTAFAANEYPDHKYIKDKQYSYDNSNAYDVTEDLEAVATGFIEGSAGNASSYTNVQSTAIAASTALQNKLGSGSGFEKFRGTWITDDANGSMYKTVSALWNAVMVKSNVKSNYGSNNDKEAMLGKTIRNYFDNGTALYNAINGAGKWNNYITSQSPYYSFALVGCGYQWPSSKGQSTNVVVDLNPEYYLWNAYGGAAGDLSKLDDLEKTLTTKYCFWWEMTSKSNGTKGTTYCVTAIMVDSPCDFIRVNADELRAFRDLFAEGDTNYWNDFKNHNFDALSDAVKLTLVSQADAKFKEIQNNVNEETKHWARTQGTDNNSEVSGDVTVKSSDADAKEGTQKLFEHYFGRTYNQFKDDLTAFYQYMVQKYLDAVDGIKAALYNDGGSEKDITDLNELRDIKILIDNAKTIRDGLSQEVIDANAATVGPNGTYTKAYAQYEQRFHNLWNTAIAKQYVEDCKAFEPYAPYEPETVKIKRDSEAKKLKTDIDAADDVFNSLLPKGVDYKTLATAPNEFTASDISVADITTAKTTRDEALKTYDAYMYSRFLEISREQLDDYFTNEPNMSSILVNDGVIKGKDGKTKTLTIFDIIPIRSQISKVASAYNALNNEYKNTANSKFFIEITTRLKAILDPITDNENFSKDNSLYQLKYPMKDVQVDTTHDLDVSEVNALIANLDKFVTSKAFRDALLNGLTADQFIDVLLQGYYMDNGKKVWGTKTDEDGNKVTMTEGLLTGKSGDDLANMILGLLLPLVQNALKDVDLSKMDLNLPLNITLSGTAYDLQCGRAKAKLGIISAGIENHGYLLCADPDDVKDYDLIKNNPGFAAAAKLLAASGSVWQNVKWKDIQWGIESTDEFFEFIGALLSLIDRISVALFFDYTYTYRVTAAKVVDQTVNLNSTFKPGDGYRKAIFPFLKILGVDTKDIEIETLYNYSLGDNGARWDLIVQRVGNALLNWAKELVTTTPIAKIVEILPSLGYMLLYDKVTEGIDTITTVLTGLGDATKWRKLLNQPDDFKVDASFVNNLLEGILGEDSEFKLPALDWAKLSYLGDYTTIPMTDYYWDDASNDHLTQTKQQKYIDAYSGDVFLYFAYYIASIITENADFLMNLAGEEVYDPITDTVKPNIGRDVLAKVIDTAGKKDQYGNAREFASAFYKFLRAYDATTYDWTKFNWTQALVDFNNISLFTKQEVEDLITYLTTIINGLIPTLLKDKETGAPKSLEDFLGEILYKSSTVDSLFTTIYKAVGSSTVQMVLQFAEITDKNGMNHPLDVSITTLETNLRNMHFDTVADKLAAFAEAHDDSYTAQDAEGNDISVFDEIHCGELKDAEDKSAGYYTDDWGITTQAQFIDALTAILSPLDYIFGVILAGGTKGHISVANTLTINGSDGYRNTFMPILSALCPGELMAPMAFEQQAPNGACIYNLLHIVFDVVNNYLDDPLGRILSAIPAIAALIDNNSLQDAIVEFISPLNNIIGAFCDLAQIDNRNPKDLTKLDHQGLFRWVCSTVLPWALNLEEGISWDNLKTDMFTFINKILPEIKLDAKDADGNKIPEYEKWTADDEKEDPTHKEGDFKLDEDGNKIPAVDKDGNPIYEKVGFPLTIPEIDWADLAGCGSQNADADIAKEEPYIIYADQASTLVKLVRYIWSVVTTNEDSITDILELLVGEELVATILENVNFFDWTGDKILAILIQVFKALDASGFKGQVEIDTIKEKFGDQLTLNTIVDMVVGTGTGKIKQSVITYPDKANSSDKYGSDDVAKFVTVLSNMVMSLLDNFAGFDLSKLTEDSLYTSGLVATVAKMIYPLFDAAAVGSVFEILGLDTYDVDSLAQLLIDNGFNDVAAAVKVSITKDAAVYPGTADDVKAASPNWIYTEKIGEDGQPVKKAVLDKDGNPVKNDDGTNKTETVYEWANRFWAKDENGAYIYTDEAKTKHAMSYWIEDKTEEGGYAFQRWTKEDQEADPTHIAGSYKLDNNGRKMLVVRDKKLSDIGWHYISDQKLFAIYDDKSEDKCMENLTNALTTVLTPFLPIVDYILNSGKISIAGAADLVGADGYANAVYPLLKLLGCDNTKPGVIVTGAKYKSDAETNKSKLLSNIITPILWKVNAMFKSNVGPVRAILDLIPDLANFIVNGGIQKLLYTLLYPIGSFADNLLTVIMDKDSSIYDTAINLLFNGGLIGNDDEDKNVLGSILGGIFGKNEETLTFANLHKNIFALVEKVFGLLKVENIAIENDKNEALYVTIKEIKLGDNEPMDLKLAIPMFDLNWVAGIGPGKAGDDYITGAKSVKKRTDSFLVIMQYIWKIVQLNKDTLIDADEGVLPTLLGETYEVAGAYIESLLDVDVKGIKVSNLDAKKTDIIDSANKIVAALVQFTENTDSSDRDVSASWDTFFQYKDYAKIDDIQYPVIPAVAADDKHTAGNKYNENDISSVVSTLTVIIQKALAELLDTTVDGLVIDALYTNKLVGTISKAICSLADNKTVASLISNFDVDLSPQGFYDVLTAYGYVDLAKIVYDVAVDETSAKYTGKLSDIQWLDSYKVKMKTETVEDEEGNEVQVQVPETDAEGNPIYIIDKATGNKIIDKDGAANYWYVESKATTGDDAKNDPTLFMEKVWDKADSKYKRFDDLAGDALKAELNAGYRFTRALVVALSPFSSLINVLFNAGTGEYFGGAIEIKGTHGYRNAVKPILTVLDCETISAKDFFDQANGVGEPGDENYVAANTDSILYNIINPVINMIGSFMNDPINEVLDIVTNFAAFFDKGGVQKAVEELLYPITQMFGPIIALATRGVEDLDGATDIFAIALSFVDLGKGVTWKNIHQNVPTIIKTLLKVRVFEKENGKLVKVLSETVKNDQDNKPVEKFYYESSEPRKKAEGVIKKDNDGNDLEDEDGNPIYDLDEAGQVIPKTDSEGNIIYEVDKDGKPVYVTDENGKVVYDTIKNYVDKADTEEIVGIDINGTVYPLEIDKIELDFSNLGSCLVNTMSSSGVSLLADEPAAAVDADTKKRSDAFVTIYRFIRRAIDANAGDLIVPLVEDALPDTTYEALKVYIDNVINYPTSEESDNILITLIRVAEELDSVLNFDALEDARGKLKDGNLDPSSNKDSWLYKLQITSDDVLSREDLYTANTGRTDVNRAIDTLWGTVNNVITKLVFKDNDKVNNLEDFAFANFMNNDLISKVAKAVFSLSDNEMIGRAFNILNITMNKKYIIDTLDQYGYKELAQAIKTFEGELKEIPWFETLTDEDGKPVLDKDKNEIMVPSEAFGQKWYVDAPADVPGTLPTITGVTNVNEDNYLFLDKVWKDRSTEKNDSIIYDDFSTTFRFSRALVVVLAPFSQLIEVLTNDNLVEFSDRVAIQGIDGYTAAIKPFLDALGCDTIHPDKYSMDADNDSNYAIYDIINPLIARVDTIMQKPLRAILGTLSTLANFINVGGIQKALENLLLPITTLLNPIIDLIMDDFKMKPDKVKSVFEIAIEYVDTALLNGVLAEAGFTWNNLHTDFDKLIEAVFPVLYTVKDGGKIYKVTKNVEVRDGEDDIITYTYEVPVLDADGNVVSYQTKTTNNPKENHNSLFINGEVYIVTIPDNINEFLGKLGACQGRTEVDKDTGSLLPVYDTTTYSSYLEYKEDRVYPAVAATLLKFIWNDVVQINVEKLIDPLLTNLVDPALEIKVDDDKKLAAYSELIRAYIIDDPGFFEGIIDGAKVTLKYNGDEFVDLVIGLMNSLDASNHLVTDWDDIITGDYTSGTVTYPTAPDATTPYTSNDVKNLVNVISNIAMAAIEAFLDLSRVGLADDNIYSSSFVVTIAKTVYPIFDSAAVQSVLEILGVERVNLEYLANRLDREGYDRTAELVRADITDSDLEVDGHKVNWTTVEKKNADGDVVDAKGNVVTDRDNQTPATVDVNRFWATDADGKYLYLDADPSYEVLAGKEHVMSYWITSEDEDGNTIYEKYTADDEKEDPTHIEGEYKVRDKQFADINWDIAADNAFFKIYGDNSGLSMDSAIAYRESLVKALSTLLYPLIDLVDFMLNSGELNIYGLTHLKGADGYQNAIYPLLQVLGCDAERNFLVTPEKYKADAKDSRLNLLTNILNPLFSRMNNILLGSEGNVSSFGFGKVILNTLPNLAIFIENGGIQKLVGELIYPIGNIVDTLIGVLSKNKTSLFNVAFDAFVTPDALALLHDADSFEGTGLTERIIEKLVVAVFNPTAKTDNEGKIDNDVLQWANVHDNIYKLASCFLKEDKDSDEPKLYLTVNDDGELEVHNIILSRTTKNDDGEEETTKYPLPAVKIPSLNTLLDNLAKLGAPIPWSNMVDGEDLNDGNSAEGIQRRTDAFVDVWSFIWGIVENNFDKDAADTENLFLNQLVDGFLKDLMGEDLFKTASPYLKTVLSRDSGRVLTAFIQATQDLATPDDNHGDEWDAYFAKLNSLTRPEYPVKNHGEDLDNTNDDELYEDADVTKILNSLSGIAQTAVSAITDKTIAELSVDLLYTDKLVATIAQAICSIASNDIAKAFLPLLDIDLSFDAIVKKLHEFGYYELEAEIKKNDKAGKDLADIEWFVQDTDEETGDPLFNEDGSKVMVPSDIAHLWYVDDAEGFENNVWANAQSNVGITDLNSQYRFTRALLVAFAPFSDLINTLFNAGTSEWFADIDESDKIVPGTGFNVTGAYGYRNAVKPLMQALGMNEKNGLMSVADFKESVKENGNDYVFFNVVNPILSRINEIITSPGAELFATLASLGSFIGDKDGAFTGKGNLQSAIEFLLSPILGILDPIIDLADDTVQLTLFDLVFEILGIEHKGATEEDNIAVTWNNVHEHLFDVVAFFLKPNKENKDALYAETLESVLYVKNITINEKTYTLKLPEYDLSKLKNCTVADQVEQRSADAFVTVFRYIERILKENSVEKVKGEFTSNLDENTFITKLLIDLIDNADTWSTFKPYIQNVFGSDTDTLLITVIRIFENLGDSKFSEMYDTVEKVTEHWNKLLKLESDTADVDYTDLAADEVSTAINTVKQSVNNAIDAYGKGFKLENLTTDYIYKDSIPALLANVIFPLGDNNLVESLLGILGAELSRTFIIEELEKNGYVELAALIKDADKRIMADESGKTTLANAIKWKVQATDEETGELLWNDEAKTDPKMVANPDIVKLWYVESSLDDFKANVWNKCNHANRTDDELTANYRFKRALVTVLAPFRELLGVFFANQNVVIFDDPNEGHPIEHNVFLKGERGYANAVKPLLEALGFDAVDAQTYLNYVDKDADYILYGIIDPLLARIDDILENPITEILDTLNSLALYISRGGLQESIKNLLYPITKIFSPIVRLLLGEVVSDKQINMVKMSGLYDLIIGFAAEFFDIEALQLTDEQRKEGFSIWDNLHKWNYLTGLIDSVLDMLNAKTTVVMINDNYKVVSKNGHYVKVTPVIEKDSKGKEEIIGYEYNYTITEDGKDVPQKLELTTKEVTELLGIEINGTVYPITIPTEGPFDKLASCQNLKDGTEAGTDAAVKEVRSNTFLALIQYVWYVVEENEPEFIIPLVKNLLGDNYDKFSKYIERVLGEDGAEAGDISTAVVRFLNAINSSDHGKDGSIAAEWKELLEQNRTATEVKYPEDGSYTDDSVNKAVQLLSDIITGVLETILETSVTELTTEKIYTNDIVNKIAGAIYPAVVGMESVLKIAGVDVSKDYVTNIIGETYGYADIAAAMNAVKPVEGKKWTEGIAWDTFDWKVDNNSDNFAHAIAAVLAPFNSLIDALLCSGEVNVASVVPIIGSNGYKNALQPLLNELGFVTTGIIDEDAPTLEGIIKVVLHKIDDIVTDENLVGKVVDILPGLANFVANGGVQKFVEELIYPITNLIDPIFRLIADDKDQTIFDFAIELLAEFTDVDLTDYGWKDVHTQLFTIVQSLIGDGITINGTTYPLTIPENIEGLNGNIFNAIAGCAVLGNGNANANSVPDTLVTLLRYVWAVVQKNSDKLVKPLVENLVGADTYSNVKKYLVNLLDVTTADEFVEAVIEILNSINTMNCNGVDWSDIYKNYVGSAVSYPIKGIKNIEAEVTADDVQDIIDMVSGVADAVIPMVLKDYASLNDFVAEKLYTDSIANALAKVLIPLCENETIVKVLSIIGVDYSGEAVGTTIETKLGNQTNIFEVAEDSGVESAKDLDWSKVTWGVKDSASFAKVLAVLIEPFTPVVDFFLNGKALPLAGAVEVAGDNGYKNVVKQLLTVLGCDLDALNAIDDSASLEAIINIVLSRVEVILDSPVDEVVGMIAGLINFVNNSGLQIMIEELVHPITNIVTPVVRLASDRVDGELTHASVFEIVFDVLKDKVDLGKDASWMNIQNNIFQIAEGFLKVDYVVVDGKNIVATKVTDKEDKNCGKFAYTVNDTTKYVDKAEQMNGIAINGIAYPLTIPSTVNDVNIFEALANCGSLNGTNDAIIGNGPDTLVTVLRYVWAIVKANENTLIVPLLKDLLNADLYKNLEGYLTNLFDSTDDQVIVALVETLNKFRKDGHTADWSKVLEKTPVTVKYPDGLKAFDVTDAIYSLTNAINFVIPMVLKSTGYKSLSALVNGVLYKDNSLIVTIADALRGLGLNKDGSESDLNKTLKKIVNIDFTTIPTNVGTVNNSATFADELAKVLAPFNEIVDAVLNGNSITIAAGILGDNAITIEGENAYVNAIKPLLGVLGCKTSGISDEKATLKDILTAVLARVDEILDSKNILSDVLAMVPDIANFINNGGIQLFVDELIYPVIRIATPLADLLGIDSVFDLALSFLGVDFDWYDIQNNLFDIIASFLKPNDKKNNLYAEIKNGNLVLNNLAINGKKYNVTIPKFDLAKLAGATDKNGKVAEATFITILRYVWNVVETNKNGFILPLLKSVLGDNYKKFGEYIEKVLANKDDAVIKALVDFLNGVDASAHKADWSFLIKNYKTANIKYPNGVTAKDLESVVEILSVAVNNALQIFLGKGLDDLVPGMIYNDSLIKTLANAMNSLKTNKGLKDVFKLLGVDFSKVNYNQKWNVTDKRSFAKALATILSPFNNVLATVLNAGEFNLEDIIDITGANGYENAIKPLLDTLGCKTVSASRYKSDALKNSNNLLLDILNPLLDRVDEILANPIEEIVGLLPAVANFINQGGIQKFVEELFYPVLELVNPIVKLVTKDNVFDFALKLLKKLGVLDVNLTWKNLQNQIIPIANSFLTNIKINGKSYKITVPNIDWSILGGCGKVSKNAIVAKDGDILLTLLRYVFKVLDANKNIIFDLVGGKNSTIGTIVNNVLKQGADGMAKIVVRILLKLDTFDNVKWTFKNIKELETKYTEHLGEKEYLDAIGQLDDMIAKLLNDMVHISLESVLGDLVYTNNIINTVAKLIYTNIEKVNIGIDLNTVLKVVDLDVSTKGVASILKDYSAASKAIGGKAKWSDVNFDSINWGFKDGNRDGFVNALSAILRPVQPILRAVLSGEDVVVLGSIHIKGGNGYNTAIIPLLEALDINPGTLVSPQQYNKEASTDKVLTNILNPLLDKVEELTHGPIDALTKILPNIAYFVYNDGIKDIAENLIAPITNILHEIDPIYSLNLDLSMLGDVDLAGLVNGILAGIKIKGQPLGIVLPDIDLATLAGRGKLVTYRSARTYFGSQMDCKKINADQAAVFISVLRYIVKTLQDNLDNIKKLIEGLGLSGKIAETIADVLGMLTSMDVDGVIEELLSLLCGFQLGGDAPAADDGSNANGIAFGSFSWFYTAYWVFFAVTVIIAMYFLSVLYGKKREDEETNPENPEA